MTISDVHSKLTEHDQEIINTKVEVKVEPKSIPNTTAAPVEVSEKS